MTAKASTSHNIDSIIVVNFFLRFVKSKYSFADTAEREPPPKGAGVTMLLYGTKVILLTTPENVFKSVIFPVVH